MARKQLIWSSSAKQELKDIVCFFCKRNGNNDYGKKLRVAFREAAKIIKDNEYFGVKSEEDENIRYVIVAKNYQLFYEITENQISIIKVWDARRNPDDLSFE